MLKANSKQAKENIKNYILENFNPCDFEQYAHLEGTTEYTKACTVIYSVFKSEKWCNREDYQYYGNNESKAFSDWCAGLPSILDTCYWYNRSATEDLGNILEETEAEKEKYSDSDACELLTSLLYREIKKNAEV